MAITYNTKIIILSYMSVQHACRYIILCICINKKFK